MTVKIVIDMPNIPNATAISKFIIDKNVSLEMAILHTLNRLLI